MKTTLLTLSLVALLVSGCSILPSHISQDDHAHTETELADPHHHDMDHGTMNHDDHTTNHDSHSMKHADMVSDPLSFISEMIPHHQEAIDTSSALLGKTQNPKLKAILENIIKGQSNEIAMMQQRLADFYPNTDYKTMYMPMMRDASKINDITTLEKMYMTDMIIHHQGAIDMAKKLLQIMDKEDPLIKVDEKTGKFRQSLRQFANDIITAQSKEVSEFQTLLQPQ